MSPLVVLRVKDLFYAQFEFINLSLNTSVPTRPVLRRAGPGRAFIVLRLPPQHIADQVFDLGIVGIPPHQAFLSCPTRIGFELPSNTTEIEYTVSGLLAAIKSSAMTPGVTSEAIPTTAIEFPDHLLLSSEQTARLHHEELPRPSTKPTNSIFWSELWNTRIRNDAAGRLRFRAAHNSADRDRPAETTLSKAQRHIIAELCRVSSDPYLISSSQFMLTALGTTARLKSDWPIEASPNLSSWEHESVMGRDQFVRTVERGFLFPFGHRASRQITKRRDFVALADETWISEIQKQVVITVEESERRYDSSQAIDGYTHRGLEMPLKAVQIVSQPATLSSETDPIRLNCIAIDTGGNPISCDLTMLFVPHGTSSLDAINSTYRMHRAAAIAPQRVALADDTGAPGSTSLTVTEFTFGVKLDVGDVKLDVGDPFQSRCLPFMESAKVTAPAVEKLLGSAAGGFGGAAAAPTREMKFHELYLSDGFTPQNRGQIFAKFKEPMPALSIPAERAGGLMAPKFQPMDGLSRVRGLVSDVASAAQGEINLDNMLDQAKLLGAITLKDIIDATLDRVPTNQLEQLFDNIDQSHVIATRPILSTIQVGPDSEVRFLWKPALKSTDLVAPLVTVPDKTMGLTVKGRIRSRSNANVGSTFDVDGRLVNFGLKFGDLITVNFDEVSFTAADRRKMEVKTKISGVKLEDGLAFIQKIQGLLSTGGLGKAPSIQPQSDGVVVRFGVAIPSFAIGILSIQNIALLTSLSLPFVEKPAAVRLSLSERSNPFLVSVSIFGGTGFFALEMRTDGSIIIEAGIEFGGIISINLLGIVRGAVYVFAGIYLSVGANKKVEASGHLRFGGYVDVAGVITVSIEFYIALTYLFDEKVLIGVGRVTISVKVLFFSLKETFSVSRRISGFGDAPGEALVFALAGDQSQLPNFTTTMSTEQWQKYCGAFS